MGSAELLLIVDVDVAGANFEPRVSIITRDGSFGSSDGPSHIMLNNLMRNDQRVAWLVREETQLRNPTMRFASPSSAVLLIEELNTYKYIHVKPRIPFPLAGPGPDPVRPLGPVHSPTRTWTYNIGSGRPSHWPGPSDLWGRSGLDTGPRGPGPTLGQSSPN